MNHDEGRRAFGRLLRRDRERAGVSQAWVASMLSHPPHGDIWTGNNVGRLERGQRVLNRQLVNELIQILNMDPDEAYEALDWWPRNFKRRDLAEFRRQQQPCDA